MRDGVELYTLVYIPFYPNIFASATVFIRTPYGTSTLLEEGEFWANTGFNVVMQDFRGRFQSKGSFDFWLNDSTDAYDTMVFFFKSLKK